MFPLYLNIPFSWETELFMILDLHLHARLQSWIEVWSRGGESNYDLTDKRKDNYLRSYNPIPAC